MRKILTTIAGMAFAAAILLPAPAHAYTCSIEGDPNGQICKTIMSIPNPICAKYGCL